MKIEKGIKVIKQEFVSYVSEDGISFESEESCLLYEKELKRKQYLAEAEKFLIKDLERTIPIDDTGFADVDSYYHWYALENENDFRILNMAYDESFACPKNFPEIMCVEENGFSAFHTDTLSELKERTTRFWKKLGYGVIFERKV